LYWRSLKPSAQRLRASVALTSVDRSQAWGKAVSFAFDSVNTTTWPGDSYLIDHYFLPIDQGAPPFVGPLWGSLFFQDAKVADRMLTSVRIVGHYQLANEGSLQKSAIRFGNAVELVGYVHEPDRDGKTCYLFRWKALNAFPDSRVMVHIQDAGHNMVSVAD